MKMLELVLLAATMQCYSREVVADDQNFQGIAALAVCLEYEGEERACVAGTGTVVNKTGIKQYQQATRDRSKVKTEGGKIIRVEAHPIPEHPRPRRVKVRKLSTPIPLCLRPTTKIL